MPTSMGSINLIRTKTSGSPQIDAIESSLRKSAYIIVSLLLVLAVIGGSAFAYLSAQKNNLEGQKAELIRRVNEAKNKEGVFLSIKERVGVISKVMDSQYPWAQVLDTIATFVVPPALTNLSVDDQNRIILTMKAQSIDEVLAATEGLLAQVVAGTIQNPQLQSFQFGKSGEVQVTLAFRTVF